MFIGNNQDYFKNFPIDHGRRRISARRASSHYSNIPTFHHSNYERSELSFILFSKIEIKLYEKKIKIIRRKKK